MFAALTIVPVIRFASLLLFSIARSHRVTLTDHGTAAAVSMETVTRELGTGSGPDSGGCGSEMEAMLRSVLLSRKVRLSVGAGKLGAGRCSRKCPPAPITS